MKCILLILGVLLASIPVKAQSAPVPAYYPNNFYDPKQLGVDCTGATDSATALQAAINTVPDGGSILFPQACKVLLGSTVSITDRRYFRMAAYIPTPSGGPDNSAPTFIWNGTGGTMFDIEHSDHPIIEGFLFQVAAGHRVDTFLNFDGNPGTNIGTAAVVNDNLFQNTASNANFVAVAISRTATNNHENYRVTNNAFSCSGTQSKTVSSNGAISSGSPNLNVSPDTPFSSGNVGQTIWVSYAGGNGLLLTTILSFTDASHVVLAANAADIATGATVKLGQAYGTGIYLGNSPNALQEQFLNNSFFRCHYGIYAANGSFQATHINGGQGDWGVYIANNAQNESIDYYESEDDQRAIEIASGATSPVTITNTRMTNGSQLADGFLKLGAAALLIDSGPAFTTPPTGAVLIGAGTGTARLTSVGNQFNLSWTQLGYDRFVDLPVVSINDGVSGPGANSFGCLQRGTAPCLAAGAGLNAAGGVAFNANTYLAFGSATNATAIQATSNASLVTNLIGIESVGDSGTVLDSETLFKADWPAMVDTSLFTGNAMYEFYAAGPASVRSPLPNLYGLYIEPQKVKNVTAGWGIYQAGTADRNYFAGNTTFGGGVSLASSTVSGLPTCNSTIKGSMQYVTDAAPSPVYNAAVSGGGSVVIPVFCNGTAWTNH